MSDYPSTSRFLISRDPERLSTDPILDIKYRASPNSVHQPFGHCWVISGYGPEYDGRYWFNRSNVAIQHEYWDTDGGHPSKTTYSSLAALLGHLEATFQEGVPHCKPTQD